MDELLTKLQKSKHRFPPKIIALGILASMIIILVIGGIVWITGKDSNKGKGLSDVSEFSKESTVTAGNNKPTEGQPALDENLELTQSLNNQTYTVYVSGHVQAPGVYTLSGDARIREAIEAAGGPLKTTNLVAINLAAHITDGQQIYVPGEKEVSKSGFDPLSMTVTGIGSGGMSAGGESANSSQSSSSNLKNSQTGSSGTAKTKPGRVNINTASSEQLELLPGIGPAIAQRIISDRSSNGPFSSPEDLMRVSGIGEKKFEAVKDIVVVR